jgi:hypothetical protein
MAECLLDGVSLRRVPQQVHVLIEHGLQIRVAGMNQCPLCVTLIL